MNSEDYKNIIRSELFNGTTAEELPLLISCLGVKTCKYKKNEYVVRESEKFEGVGFVVSGNIVIIKETYDGNRAVLANFKQGDIFGEIIAFSDYGVWPSTVVADSECKIMFIHPNKILGMCSQTCGFHKNLISNITRIISKKALILNKKVEYLTIKSIKVKLAKYILEQYKKNKKMTVDLPLNREGLAEFLNVSRPSMSRELCKMRDEGIIEFYRETIKIKDIERLEMLSQN